MTGAGQGKRDSHSGDGRTCHGRNDIWTYLLFQISVSEEVSSR